MGHDPPSMGGELERRKREAPRALVPVTPTQSTASLVREALADAVDVLQAHVALATVEIREDARAAGRVAMGFAIGGALTVLAVGFLGTAAALALALVLPTWAAFSIVGTLVATAAAVTVARVRRQMAAHDFTPERTLAMLQENPRWPADQTDDQTDTKTS